MDSKRVTIVNESLNNNEMYFNFYMKQKYVDTVIKCSNGVIKVHSCILENNNVFNNLLGPLQNNDVMELNLSRFSMEVMRVVIEYIYRGDSKYFREIGHEVKRAIKYFFNDTESTVTEANNSVIEVQKVDVKTIVLSDSEEDETICEDAGKAIESTLSDKVEDAIDLFKGTKLRVTDDAYSNSIIEAQKVDLKTIVLSDSEETETICKDVEKAKKSTASPPRSKRDVQWISARRNILSPSKKHKNPVALARTLMENSHKDDRNEFHNPSQSGSNLASSQKNKNPFALAKAVKKNSNREDRNELHNPSHSINKPTLNPVSCSQSQHHEKSDEEDYCNIFSGSEEEDKQEKVPDKVKNLSKTRNQKLNKRNPPDTVYDSTDDEDSLTMKILRENRMKMKPKSNRIKFTFQVEKLDVSQLLSNNNDSRKNNVQETSMSTEIDENSENPAPIRNIIVHKSTVINKPRIRGAKINKNVENSTLKQKNITTITSEQTSTSKKNKFLENPVLVVALDRLPLPSTVSATDLENSALENSFRNEDFPTSSLHEDKTTGTCSLQDSPSNVSVFSEETTKEGENDESNNHFIRKGKAGNIKITKTQINWSPSKKLRKYSRCMHCLVRYPKNLEFTMHQIHCDKKLK